MPYTNHRRQPLALATLCATLGGCSAGTLTIKERITTINDNVVKLALLLTQQGDGSGLCSEFQVICDQSAELCQRVDREPTTAELCTTIGDRCDRVLSAHCTQQTADAGVHSDGNMPRCGDDECHPAEDCGSCAADCGTCVEPQVLTLHAAADAFVDAATPTSNLGSQDRVKVDTGPTQRGLVRFAIPSSPRQITKAVLRLHVLNRSAKGPALYSTRSPWRERSVTWETQPMPEGPALTELGETATGWIEVDVTASIAGDEAYSVLLWPSSSDGFDFSSREGEHAAQLILTYGGDHPRDGNQPPPAADASSDDFSPDAGPPNASPICGDGRCEASEGLRYLPRRLWTLHELRYACCLSARRGIWCPGQWGSGRQGHRGHQSPRFWSWQPSLMR